MKIALGGALYAISGNINSVEEAARYAESLAEAARQFELDGGDLDVEDGGSPVEIQVRVAVTGDVVVTTCCTLVSGGAGAGDQGAAGPLLPHQLHHPLPVRAVRALGLRHPRHHR